MTERAAEFREVAEIDYERLGRAKKFYVGRGYKYVEVPWAVGSEIIEATCPPEARPLRLDEGGLTLIGSAEQGFLDLAAEKKASEGGRDFRPGTLYFSISPCFRGEPRILKGETQLTFMKVELFAPFKGSPRSSGEDLATLLRRDAAQFMATEGGQTREEPTAQGVDLYCSDHEVGSYGIRQWKDIHWAYGTGLAEPRFSYSLISQSIQRNQHLKWHT